MHFPLEKPPRPPHMPHFPPSGGKPHRVSTGETWVTIAQKHGLSPRELIHFNFNNNDPHVVNWCLRHIVGCHHTTHDGLNYVFSSKDSPGEIYLPMHRAHPGASAPAPRNNGHAAPTMFAPPVQAAPKPSAPAISNATQYAPHAEVQPPPPPAEYQPSAHWYYDTVASLAIGELVGGGVWLFVFKNDKVPYKIPVLFIGGGFVIGLKHDGKIFKLDKLKGLKDGLIRQIVGKFKLKFREILDGFSGTPSTPLHVLTPFSYLDLSFAFGALASASASIGMVGLSLSFFEAQPTNWQDRLGLLFPGAGDIANMASGNIARDRKPYFVAYPSEKTFHALDVMANPIREELSIGWDLITKGRKAAMDHLKKDVKDVTDTLTGGTLSLKKLEVPSLGANLVGGLWVPLTPDLRFLSDALTHG